MDCPNCRTKVSLKKYFGINPQGFICSGCKAWLVVDQSKVMLRYVVYLAVLLFLKYFFEMNFIGIILFLVVAAWVDFMFVAKVKVVDDVGDNKG